MGATTDVDGLECMAKYRSGGDASAATVEWSIESSGEEADVDGMGEVADGSCSNAAQQSSPFQGIE